jgi:HlyD family secretion protein
MNGQPVLETAGPSGTRESGRAGGPVPAEPGHATPGKVGAPRALRKALLFAVVIVVGIAGYLGWKWFQPAKLPPGFARANGRIEATEIDIATKLAERIKDELVDEGDFVTAGQVVAHMNIDVLQAKLREAEAKLREAESSVESANKTVTQRKAEKSAAEAVVVQREADCDLAKKNLVRAEALVDSGGMSKEDVDTRRSALAIAAAAILKARADVAASDASVSTAESLVIRTHASVEAARATIESIRADITDSALTTPRSGRVQYRVAQPGEVLPAGGKVLNLIDLSDVYMTFFLPEAEAGQVKIGTEVRLVLDAYPQFVIPAQVTFVADVAQFTPKTVETAVERQKLTFRIKAHIPPELLEKYILHVKTGLPGVAYVQLDPEAPWPTHLEVKLP